MFTYRNIIIVTVVVVRRCSVKIVFLKFSQNLQENTCGTGVFPVNFSKFLTTPFLQNISERLLLILLRIFKGLNWSKKRVK